MRGSTIQFRWILSATAMTLFPLTSVADNKPKGKEWKLGASIITYWAGPAMTDAAAQQLADGGWNLVWCTRAELDIAHRHGLRAQLTDPLLVPESLEDPAKLAALSALVASVKTHPALYSYFITDEPDSSRFAGLGKLVAYLKQQDPAHLAYINLFPTYATNEQLGNTGDAVTAYKRHLHQFIETVKPSLLSYDHYQFSVRGDMPDYFLNLALVRRAAIDARIPFLNIVQACTWTPSMREPSEDEMRYLVYTTMAYGAQGISYYVYSHPGHTPGIASLDGEPTRVYGWLQKLHPQFLAITAELEKLRSSGAYHAGMLPPGAEPVTADLPFQFEPALPNMVFKKGERVQGALFGCFGKAGRGVGPVVPTYALVVNLDYKAASRFSLRGHGKLEIFDPLTRKWTSAGKLANLDLPPGGGALVRTRN